MKKYNPNKIERKWHTIWDTASQSQTNAEQTQKNAETSVDKPKYYILDMFPYPSGDGLHMGHTESYTASDIIYRYKRLQGFDVLHPQGFDSFGLPAENYAIKTGVHPKETTETNASNYIQQMKMLGLGHDLNHLVYTSRPDYYQWTQWLFGKFFENGLVEQKTDKINWCPSCNTGIANEQVEQGKCERCKTEIQQKEVPGWFFKITDFAEDLIKDLDKVDWPEATKKNQRNWIGKSEGAKIKFKIVDADRNEQTDTNCKNSGQHFSQNKQDKFEIRNLKFEMNDEISNDTINENKISNVVLMHGKDTNPNQKWYPWLADEMQKQNIKFTAPKLPRSDDPDIKEWMNELDKLNIDKNFVLIGHSRGGVAILRWLEKQPKDFKVKKVILVATNYAKADEKHTKENTRGFYTKNGYDFKKIKQHCDDFVVLHSEDDEWVPFEAGIENSKGLNAKFLQFKNRGHFGSKLPKQEIPELLDEILRTDNREPITNIEVFTTRPDTLFGATYLVLAPEHKLINNEKLRIKNWDEVVGYIEKAKNKTEMERMEAKEKTGVKLEGIVAVNPANGEEIPIFVADYVLGGYGTGAIMAVPAHDERDYEFATRYNESLNDAERTQKNAEEARGEVVPRRGEVESEAGNLDGRGATSRSAEQGNNLEKIKIKEVVAPNFILENESACKEDKETLKRLCVDVVIENKKGEFLLQKDSHWHFVGGGVEKGDSLEETVIKEVREETGYTNIEIERLFLNNIFCEGYRETKDKNQKTNSTCFHIKILDENRIKSEVEDGKHIIEWVKKEDVEKRIEWEHHRLIWKIFNGVVFTGNGKLVNSGEFDRMSSEEAKKKITEFVGGEMTVNYRLRDWSISRQRYWGCPIPIVYSPEGEAKFVGEDNLPWLLPEDVDFVPDGTAPLAKSKELRERVEKLFGRGWTPEVDTMDTFVDSSWYFLRYPDPENDKEFCAPEKLKRWLPVDLYIGGAEHTYMHLLYARFFVKAMHKMKLLDFDEPFMKLRHQGMVLDKDGVKMSKSKGNVINPNDMVEKFGADATRMYMMFAGPLEEDVMFKEEGVRGVYRFLEKVFSLFKRAQTNTEFTRTNADEKQIKETIEFKDCENENRNDISRNFLSLWHKTIKGVTDDIENLRFNTAISKLMIFINECSKHKTLPKSAMKGFLILLSPFAPHLAEELFTVLRSQIDAELMRNDAEKNVDEKNLNNVDSIFNQSWPKYNPKMIEDESVEMVIQINGKVRDKMQVPADISEEDAKKKALQSEKIKKYIDGKEIKKIIFVKGRLISLVV